jgi:hypothetical protein
MSEAKAASEAGTPLPAGGEFEYFTGFDFSRLDDSLESLLKAGVHFGHLKSRRHPRMEEYIFTTRKNINILNLEKTKQCLEQAAEFLTSVAKNVDDIIEELKSGKLKNVAERSGRLQDGKHGLEELRREGYM